MLCNVFISGLEGEIVPVETKCTNPFGMQDQTIAASQISASSILVEPDKDYSPTQARLYNVPYLKSGIQFQGSV